MPGEPEPLPDLTLAPPQEPWSLVFERARRDGFTHQDRLRACDWQRCAAGVAPKGRSGAPTDPTVSALGLRFADQVIQGLVNEAEDTHERINMRVKP